MPATIYSSDWRRISAVLKILWALEVLDDADMRELEDMVWKLIKCS